MTVKPKESSCALNSPRRITLATNWSRKDCDRVVAFVASDRKGGTEDTIKRALKAAKPVEIR
jgi:hypothetical protein